MTPSEPKKLIKKMGATILVASHFSCMPLTTTEPQKTESIASNSFENEQLNYGDPKSGRELRRERRKSNRKNK